MKSLCPDDKFVAKFFDLMQENLLRFAEQGDEEVAKGLPITYPYTGWHMVGIYYSKLIDLSYELERMVKAGATRNQIHTMLIQGM